MRHATFKKSVLTFIGFTASRCCRIAILFILSFCCGCCMKGKGETATPQPPVHYVHQDDLDVTWREEQTGRELRLVGVLRNNHYRYLENLCLTVHLLDDQGGVVHSKSYPGFPMILPPKGSAPFVVTFPLPAGREKEGVSFDFGYWLPNPVGPDYPVFQKVSCAEPVQRPPR